MLHDSFMLNNELYNLVEFARSAMSPFRYAASNMIEWNKKKKDPYTKSINAGWQLIERITRNYSKPEFNIREVTIEEKSFLINEKVILAKTFCDIIHFKKSSTKELPKMLVIAPMSGHFATLCKSTVEELLPYFDVYITNWKNSRDIELNQGSFDMDDFINYLIDFFDFLGGDLHTIAVCQPSPLVVAAVSIMSQQKSKNIPKSITLVGGPIDTRINQTEVNKYAEKKDMQWFESNVITKVPFNYKGFMRRVYPGFIQLSGFVAMNLERHTNEHIKLFQNLIRDNDQDANKHIKFYDEYFAVMDLPSEFYLQTIKEIFKDHSLARGTMISRGRKIDLSAIKNTSLLVIEGGRDDITGVGQTKVVLDLCKNVPDAHKKYYLEKDVGHFGLFSGSKFKSNIVPKIVKFAI